MGTNFLIRCGVVLLVADDQQSYFMTNGHLPPVWVRLSFVRGLSVLHPRLATLTVSRYSGSSVSPTWRFASYGETHLSVVRGLLRSLYLNSLGVLIPILSTPLQRTKDRRTPTGGRWPLIIKYDCWSSATNSTTPHRIRQLVPITYL